MKKMTEPENEKRVPEKKAMYGFYSYRVVEPEGGDIFEAEVSLHRRSFSRRDVHNSYYDAYRTEEKGDWKYWDLSSSNTSVRQVFQNEFGESSLPENNIFELEGYISISAFVELRGKEALDDISHLDPGEDGERIVRKGSRRLYRVMRHPETGSIGLSDGSYLLY